MYAILNQNMLVKNMNDCKEFVAGDGTLLREVLHPKNDGVELKFNVAYARVKPGKSSFKHRMKTSTEVYYILNGRGMMYIDKESKEVGVGSTVYIPPNSVQYIKNLGTDDLEFVCIVNPPWTADDEAD